MASRSPQCRIRSTWRSASMSSGGESKPSPLACVSEITATRVAPMESLPGHASRTFIEASSAPVLTGDRRPHTNPLQVGEGGGRGGLGHHSPTHAPEPHERRESVRTLHASRLRSPGRMRHTGSGASPSTSSDIELTRRARAPKGQGFDLASALRGATVRPAGAAPGKRGRFRENPLLRYLWEYRWRYALGLGALVGASFAAMAPPFVLRDAIDAIDRGVPRSALVGYVAWILVLAGIESVLR